MRFPLLLALGPSLSLASVFQEAEPMVRPSPALPSELALQPGEQAVELDVSPLGPDVAVIACAASDECRLVLWTAGSPAATARQWRATDGFRPISVAWHPDGHRIFLAGRRGDGYEIVSLDASASFASSVVYTTPHPLKRLLVAPRPYVTAYGEGDAPDQVEHRLFFGEKDATDAWTIRSVTERGTKSYQVVGAAKEEHTGAEEWQVPSELVKPHALPLSFYPAGDALLWDDGACPNVALYARSQWAGSDPLLQGKLCGSVVSFAPNGAGILEWKPDSLGVALLVDRGKTILRLAAKEKFLIAPRPAPDGNGLVGIEITGPLARVVFVRCEMPMADIVNAWMFAESSKDRQLFTGSGGLLRPLDVEQLYALYDQENYDCGDYDPSTPTRPYLVTTDVFWDLFASAFQGVFIVKERKLAMPAFWDMVAALDRHFQQAKGSSRWPGVFSALAAVKRGDRSNPEAARILDARGSADSAVLGEPFDYGELKPRGHYTKSVDTKVYFVAFKYLTAVPATDAEMDELAHLPPGIQEKARAWVAPYAAFIASPRGPLVWGGAAPPKYLKYGKTTPRVFPLSWGFDNEVLDSVVFHPDRPEAEQVKGPAGPRLLPQGLDLAAALGSRFARTLLDGQGEIARYPALDFVLEDLGKRFGPSGQEPRSLYELWIDGLAAQWSDAPPAPDGARQAKLWYGKRLQTGLASWATLRHATVLVNERPEAECGEAGFEPVVMRPPRGYVEPDPATFGAIAALFESELALVEKDPSVQKVAIVDPYKEAGDMDAGIARRLRDCAEKARKFEAMAKKEVAGQELTPDEYEEILYVGRVAEHNMKIFSSLARKDLSLANPDPMPKIADVAGGASGGYLLCAVGWPLEWDLVVPFFGRREVVKGAVYSYYELASDQLLDDEEWGARVKDAKRPQWIAPFVSPTAPTCPPPLPF